MQTIRWTSFDSPIGTVYLASTKKGVCSVTIPASTRADFISWLRKHFAGWELVESRKGNEKMMGELKRYFEGKLTRFKSKLDPRGTPFQRKVWSQLRKIPYGTTITYKQLAQRVKSPAGFQAVGRANATNPLPIVIPCHRVVGSDDDLVGYGAGIKTKEYLLRLEGALML